MQTSDLKLTCWKKTKPYLYDMRWYMVYQSGEVKRGRWTMSDENARAADEPREGLVEVGIETNNKLTNVTRVVARCSAVHFKEFRWVVTTSIPMVSVKNLTGRILINPSHEGLTLVKNYGLRFTFFVDGSIVKD